MAINTRPSPTTIDRMRGAISEFWKHLVNRPRACRPKLYFHLTGKPPRSDFERLLAEEITTLAEDGLAPRWLVMDSMTSRWFDHLYEPYYFIDEEYTWARFFVARSEVKRKLAKLEGDFVITTSTKPAENTHDN